MSSHASHIPHNSCSIVGIKTLRTNSYTVTAAGMHQLNKRSRGMACNSVVCALGNLVVNLLGLAF
jgi:hypothetical protein